MRILAKQNSLMQYFNVSLLSLNSKIHPVLSDVITGNEVRNMRSHLKMLTGNFLTYETKSKQSGGAPHWRLGCRTPEGDTIVETLCHILSTCSATRLTRQNVQSELHTMLSNSIPYIDPCYIFEDIHIFTQFIIDPTSMNLQYRVHMDDPMLPDIFRLSRNFCAAVDKKRMNLLRNMCPDWYFLS